MGSEDLHHKRKARAEKEQGRKNAKRASYDRVLIVCEGKKTEPNYFNELINHYKLNTANVQIDKAEGSSPKNVLESAEKYAKKATKEGNAYDRIYCVFDKDNHNTYQQTVNKIEKKKDFYACVSVPCFEYWLLLHFEYKTSPYHASGNKSICAQVIKDLKAHIPNYEKGYRGTFKDLESKLEIAKSNAKKALKAADRNDTDNPTTHIHELVDYLINLKK